MNEFSTPHRRGFTLIEMLAVVVIIGLTASLALPQFGVFASRTVDNQAKSLVADLEAARQRAIVTGIPHRLNIDLELAIYRVEWLAPEADDTNSAPVHLAAYVPEKNEKISLEAPRREAREWVPIPNQLGKVSQLTADVDFGYVETIDGLVDRGRASIVFHRDGSATAADILLVGDDTERILEVLPLADRVRIFHAE